MEPRLASRWEEATLSGFRNNTLSLMIRSLLILSSFAALASSLSAVESIQLSDTESEQIALEIEGEVPVTLAEGLEARIWAPEQLLNDPVAIDVTDTGEVWVSATRRRQSSMFDIRMFADWVEESWRWETVGERADFLRRELSPKNSEENTWLTDFNEDGSHDWRDLLVENEEVYRLLDHSGDGRADISELYRWIESSVETDIAGAILVHEGAVYLGLLPDLWRIQDLDGNGKYERKKSISSGYGIHIGFGGHAISGLKVGPDGRIYWGVGDVGFNGVDRDGKRWKYPRQGVVVRSEPDGSGFEVYAHGLRNVHEFDWDAMGNLIGVDNDGDHAGEDERLVYLINGSDSGWRNNWQLGKYTDPKNNAYKVWMDELYFKPRFPEQAAHILPPLENYRTGPAGLVFQPGTALGGRWVDHFFMASFTGNPANSAIYAYSLKPNGASFSLDSDKEILSGITSVGIDFGPEGALYLADWGGGWSTDGMGRVWKVDTERGMSALALDTQSLLKEEIEKMSSNRLAKLLGHADRRVRLKAQFGLVKRRETSELLEIAYEGSTLLSRVHAIWGVGQLARFGEIEGERLLGLLNDPDPEIRAQAARTLGDIRCVAASEGLRQLLSGEAPRIQLMATEALGRIGDQDAFEDLLGMLEANNDEDVYLRHAGAIALARIDDGERLQNLAGHPSRAVRIAGVVALDRIDHEGVVRFLNDRDDLIATAAARAINDEEHLLEGLGELASRLGLRRNPPAAFTRRSINANLYSGSDADAARLAAFATNVKHDFSMRIEAVNTLSVWADSSVYDRVSGRVLPRPENDLSDAQSAITSIFDELLRSDNQGLRVAVIEAAGNLKMGTFEQSLLRIVEAGPSVPEKTAALNALVSMDSDLAITGLELALADPAETLRSAALERVTRLTIEDEQLVGLLEVALENGSLSEVQAAIETLGTIQASPATRLLTKQFEALDRGDFPLGALLELLTAAEQSDDPSLSKRLERYRSELESKAGVERFEASLLGGDPDKGREIVYTAPAAQCIRCHAIGGEGGDVGPELGDIGMRLSRGKLLESLVDPSADIALGYGIVTVNTKDGDSIQGILVGENDRSLEIKVGAKTVAIEKTAVAERLVAPSSMPPMGLLLNPSQLRDVVAFLVESRGVPSTETGSSHSEGAHGD